MTFPKITLLLASLMLLFALTGCAATVVDHYTGMQFVFVKGGWYEMGSNKGNDDEKPVHDVCVSDFWIGKYEVKQSEWNKVMGSNPSANRCGDDCPVENVSWLEAQNFIKRLNEKSTNSYRLPTEAEWEYAARSGGKDQKWSGTNEIGALGDYARYCENSAKASNPVGTRKPNGLGTYDMSGNIYEWCQDAYDETYFKSSPAVNPTGAAKSEYRVAKGGSGRAGDDQLRVSYRFGLQPDQANGNTGLRILFADRRGADDPCKPAASVYVRKAALESTDKKATVPAPPDIEGSWSNGSSGFSKAGFYFTGDGKGFFSQSDVDNFDKAKYEKMMNVTWSMESNGNMTITMKYPFESNFRPVQGHYDANREEICLFGKDQKCAMKLYPVQDKTYRAKLKKYLPPASESGGRYVFTAETATDSDTGLVWSREGDLSGSGGGNYLKQVLAVVNDLNARRYGGRNDWRVPSLSEMHTLIESVVGGPPIPAFPDEDNFDIKLNDLGFIAIKRDVCYWTSDLCPKNQNCNIDLMSLSAPCETRDKDVLPVAGKDFRIVGKARREQ